MKRILVAVAATMMTGCLEIDPDEQAADGGTVNEEQVAACAQPEKLPRKIEGELIVGAECSNWIVENPVSIPEGSKLVIQPGTTLTFGSGTQLHLEKGSLVAAGTAALPIVLTGAEQTPGYWNGVILSDASSSENRLSHVTIEYAGGAKSSWADAAAALTLIGSEARPSRIAVDHSTFRHSKAYGISLTGKSRLPAFADNTLTANAEGAAYGSPGNAGEFTTSNSYTGNGKERVHLKAGDIKTEVTLGALGVPFQSGRINVVDGKLTVEPGATLAFESGAELMLNKGKLAAAGTAEKKILFTGVEPTRGYWKGIVFSDSSSAENVLQHATVEYAGVKVSWADAAANVMLVNEKARVRISDTTLRESAGYGLYIDAKAEVSGFTGNTLTANALGAAYVHVASAHHLLGESTYTGNQASKDFVYVNKGSIESERTWSALDVPFHIEDFVVVPKGAQLTIRPGATLKFATNGSLRAEGVLTAVGTSTEKITFTKTPDASRWMGVQFNGSSSPGNKLEYVELTQAGHTKYSWANEKAGLAVVVNSSVSVANSRFADNDGFGVWISSNSTVTGCGSAKFEGNTTNTPNAACN